MNIEEYISTGILEAYVLGELSDAERADVERNLAQYPPLREELSKIEAAVETLLLRSAVQPPASVKTKIMEAIEPKGKVVPMNPVGNTWKYAVAASVTIALVSSFLAFTFWSKWKNTELALNDLIAQNQQMAQNYNQVNQRLDKIESDLKITDNPAFARVVMNGTPNAPDAMASVYWNEKTQEVYLSIQNLRELAQENQYQLWAIIDGKPVDAGVFDSNNSGLIRMNAIRKGAVTFAVTIEPRGGKPSPTLETMQVAGNVAKV